MQDRRGPPHPPHRGKVGVPVGPYTIRAGGLSYLRPEDFRGVDVIIPLEDRVLPGVEQMVRVLRYPWPDFAPPPEGFEQFLRQQVIPLLEQEKQVMSYCIGSHGRTGTFLAFLIALLEPGIRDPIAAVRERHCPKAVETPEQARAVFALLGRPLPELYRQMRH